MFELRFDDHKRSLEINEGSFVFIGNDTGEVDDAIYREWSECTDNSCPNIPLTPEIQTELLKIQAEAEGLYERAKVLVEDVSPNKTRG